MQRDENRDEARRGVTKARPAGRNSDGSPYTPKGLGGPALRGSGGITLIGGGR